MTILTPTSNPQAGDLPGHGVPDIDTLTRMATEFFTALPGREPSLVTTSHPAPPPGVSPDVLHSATPPRGSEPALALGNGSPMLTPVSAPSQVPSSAGVPRSGNAIPSVPEAYAANGLTVPDLGLGGPARQATPALPAGSPSFYFIEEVPAASPAHRPAHADAGQAQPVHPAAAGFDIHAVRRDFPILQERVNGKPLVWFDNAATTQKPQSVIDRISHFYAHENSNIHRAAHELAARATDAYEAARQKVADFLGAASTDEIIFVRGATEAINLVAKSWGAANIGAGDEIIVSHLEHHANIVPWQQLAAEKGARLKVIPVDDTGQVLLDRLQALFTPRTRLVAVTQVSNALGTVVPVTEIVAMAHAHGALVLVDGAQSVSHMPVNMQAMGADFFVFSGHKVFGPTGIGVVYGRKAILDQMPPWQGGGNMIVDVTFEHTTYHGAPARFEAGTGNIADAVGLGAAIDYVQKLGLANIGAYEHALLDYATHPMKAIPGVRLIGTAAHKASVLSFVLDGYKPEEVGHALNQEGIAVRSGHHCAQPILRRFGLEATVRPSLAFYNTCEEIDRMVQVVRGLAR